MGDYLKEDKKKKLKGNLIKILIILLVFLCLVLSYIIYDNIKISNNNGENIKAERTITTIEETKEKGYIEYELQKNHSMAIDVTKDNDIWKIQYIPIQ